tara:strand:- start:12470 stop:12904 length:435 start_codon:yes stop_codon:yes gene_type:complete
MVDRVVDVDPDFEIVEYCGRLSCRKPILQSSGRGRRKEFCSDTCRRGADRDYKRAKALVEHFEQSLRRTRHEVAAYGRKAEADSGFRTPEEESAVLGAAQEAIGRAEGIIEFATETDDRYLAELRRLVEAVSPAVRNTSMRASA